MDDDLISRSELRAAAIKATAIYGYEPSEFSFDNCYPYWQFSKCIKDAPVVDAVPVVRCKECKYFMQYTEEYKYTVDGADGDCKLSLMYSEDKQFIAKQKSDFCSYGVRKDDVE